MLSLASNMLEVYRVPPPAAATAEGKKKAHGRRRSGSTGSVGSVASEADDVAATVAGPAVPTKQSLLELPGHRSDVRAVCLSADGSLAATCASDGVKVWSTKTCACLRSCGAAGYGVAVAFAPGARYVLVGTKDGHVQVVDSASGDVVVDHAAHTGKLFLYCGLLCFLVTDSTPPHLF
jgi:U3 small nucleolar RNA-associated protein 12